MIDFKPKRILKVKKSTPLSRLLSNSAARFTVAGFLSVLVTLLLFIFMNYLLGNFDKYAQTITEKLFSLQLVSTDKVSGTRDQSGNRIQRIPRPVEPPEQPVLQGDDNSLTNEQRRKLIIESILENNEDMDNGGKIDKSAAGPSQTGNRSDQ